MPVAAVTTVATGVGVGVLLILTCFFVVFVSLAMRLIARRGGKFKVRFRFLGWAAVEMELDLRAAKVSSPS